MFLTYILYNTYRSLHSATKVDCHFQVVAMVVSFQYFVRVAESKL